MLQRSVHTPVALSAMYRVCLYGCVKPCVKSDISCRLVELNEHIEVLEAAIQFKNETITSRELKASQILESEELHTETAAKLQDISHTQAKLLLASYFDKVVALRLLVGKKEKEHLKMVAEIEEKRKVIQSLQRSVKQIQVEMERRLLKQEKVRMKLGGKRGGEF